MFHPTIDITNNKMISKINNKIDLLTIPIHKTNNINVNQIVVIDNVELGLLTKIVKLEYQYLLSKYIRVVNLHDLLLISPYPCYDIYSGNKSNYHNIFKKVQTIYNVQSNEDQYESIFQSVLEAVNKIRQNNDYLIEISVFMSFNNNISNDVITMMNRINNMNNINICIIQLNSKLLNIPNDITKIIYQNNKSKKDFVISVINKGLFLTNDLNSNHNIIELEGLIYGDTKLNINVNVYNNIFIKSNNKNITIDKVPIKLNGYTDIKIDNLINGIKYMVDHISLINGNTNLLIYILDYTRDVIRNIIIDKPSNKLLNRLVILNYKLSGLHNKIRTLKLGEYDNDIIKIILTYITKSRNNLNRIRHNNRLNNRMTDNIKLIDEIKDLTILSNIYKKNKVVSESYHRSNEFCKSLLTLSTWDEEILNNNCIGILIKVNINEYNKIGLINNIQIEEITNTFMPIVDYIETIDRYFKDSNQYGIINNKDIISGNAIGKSNTLLPIYINKYHWSIVYYFYL
jgi:hypothetical protein